MITVDFSPAFTGGAISVTATNACGTSPARSRYLSFSRMHTTHLEGSNRACPDHLIKHYSTSLIGGATYTWTVGGGATVMTSQAGNEADIDFTGVTPGPVHITVTVANACGESQNRSKWVEVRTSCNGDGHDGDHDGDHDGNHEGDHDGDHRLAMPVLPGVTVYPNPAVDEVNVSMESTDGADVVVTIVDIVGNVVLTEKQHIDGGQSVIRISTKYVVPGIYLLTVQSPEVNAISRIAIDK